MEKEKAADLITEAQRVVVFTGAGVSTESGISDFRSPGGIWDRYDPDEFLYHRFLASEETRKKYWDFERSLWPTIVNAEPNPAHIAVVELHQLGKLDCVITQNIDGLHQKAGLPEEKVIELHGTLKYVECLGCGKRFKREEIQKRMDEQGVSPPRCEDCQGILKPATISFGQPMPEWETRETQKRSANCDLFMVIGSSLVVYPAAEMPVIAKQRGAHLVIINMAPTPHDTLADVIIRSKAGDTMSEIVSLVKAKLRR